MKKSILTLLTFVGLTLNSLAQPNISGRTPSRHAINVATNANVNILFNTTMDESSVNANTVIISGSQHGIYAGTYSFSTNTAIFNPDTDFYPGELITVTVTTGVENSSDVPKAEPDIYTFTVSATSDGSFQNFGNYTAVSGNDTEDVVLADIDEDGDLDVITLTPIQDKLSVFKNNGDGTYSGPTNYTTLNAQDLEAVDVDNDGDIDIVTSNNNAKMMSVFMNNGSGAGTFAASVDYDNGSSHNGLNMTVADMNSDGFTDVIISNIAGSPTTVKVAVFMNSGTGTFGTPTEYAVTTSGFTLGAVDYNNDGAMDIVLADAANDVIRLWENDGTGALLSGGTLPVGDGPYNIAFAKLDSDSYIDVITPNIYSDNVSVRLASGGFAFFNSASNTTVGDGPFAVVTGDMDADGDIDIVVTNGTDKSVSILANNGFGNGFTATTFILPDYTSDLKLADVDNDGDLDIVVVNSDGFSVIKNSDGPTISSITPSNGDFNISASSNIVVVFDQDMDSATLTSSNLKFKSSTRGLLAGSYSYNSGTKTLTFDPTTDLKAGETISTSTSPEIKNSIGGSFGAGFSSSFVVATTDGGSLAAKTDFSVGTNPKDAILADLDADGDLDLITVQTSVDSISVMINNGSGFNTPVYYYTGDAPVSVVAGDVDGDGDQDLLVSVSGENVLAKFINNGSGVFAAKTTYATTGVPGAVLLQDINYDGDLDAVFANGNQIVYLSNNGSGTFADQWNLTGFSDRNLIAVDLNNDGDDDYVMVRNNSSNQLVVLTRNALNDFSQSTYNTDTNPRGVAVGDFDNDGDIDAVTVNYGFSTSNISFFANNGSGAFAARVDYSLGSLSTPEDLIATDIDGDGDLDIVVAKTGSDQVVVFTNNGSASFTLSGSFTTGDAPSALVAADLNTDGSMDVITTNGSATSVSVLNNIKPLQITALSPTRNDINIASSSNIDITFNQDIDEATAISANFTIAGSVSGSIEGAFSFNSGTDVLTFNPTSSFISGENISVLVSTNVESSAGAALSSVTQWSFNVGSSGGEVLLNPVSTEDIDEANAVKFLDIDNDGDADIVTSLTNYSDEEVEESGIEVLLNNGSGVYSNSDTTKGIYGAPKQLSVADFNQDGYLDVAGTTKGSGSNSYVEVFINNQAGSFNAPVTYMFVSDYPVGITSGDINSDGYPDILTTRYGNDVIHVLLNDGDGTFTAQSTVGVGDGPYLGMALYDVDSDGDLDLISTNWDGANISVAKNNGNGTFASSTQYSIKSNYAGNLTGGDIDGDGDIDLVVISTDEDEDASESVTVFFNNGSGDYSTSTEIVDYADAVNLADFDGDGDLDLFVVYETNVKIYKNNGSGTFSAYSYQGSLGNAYVRGIDVADNNGDGDIDVAVSTSSGLVIFENGDFVTVSSTSPTKNSINVSASSNITATFNVAMNSDSLNATTVIVNGSQTGKVAGVISYAGNTMTFNPTNDFKPGEVISLSLTTDIESASGTVLYSAASTSFVVAASGNGNFVYRDSVSLGASFQEFVSADMDGDGDVDLVGIVGSNIIVYENNAGNFSVLSTLVVTSSPYGLIVLDLDNDGDLDVIANSSSNSDVFIIVNDGSGTLANSSVFNSGASSYVNIRMKAGDFNGDGLTDFTYRIGNAILYIAKNNGDLTFTSQYFNSVYYSYLATGDIDNDNDIDIVGIGDDGLIQIMLNSGSGSFSKGASYATSTNAKDIKLADLNNDGYLDVLIASYDGYAFDILMNNANGTYAAKTTYAINPYQAGRIDAFDYDGDGDLDLAIHAYDDNADDGEFLMMAYNINGTFGNQVLFQYPIDDPYYYYDFSIGAYTFLDVDSDGDLDLVAKLSGNNLAIALNTAAGASSAPTTAASSISIDSKTYSSATFSWTNGNGYRRMILVKEGSAVNASPSDNGGYSPSPTFENGSEIGTGNFVVYGGSGSSTTVTGLTGSTTYHIQIFELNGVPGQEKFYLTDAPVANFTTNPPPVLWDKDNGTVTITKADDADYTLAANQDRIAYNIWLTRKGSQALYNAFSETEYSSSTSPKGTEWALGTVEDIATLSFTNLKEALDDHIGDNIVDTDMVLHLIDADIYVDIKFSSWTQSESGGGYSYTRGTGTAPAEPTGSFETTAGKAISFNGSSNNLRLDTDHFIPDTFTTEFWVKTTSASTEQIILSYDEDLILVGINSSNQFFVSHQQRGLESGGGEEEISKGGDIKIKKNTGSKPSTAETVTITGATTINTNQWYHVAVTAESGGNIILCLNGTQDASASITTASADGYSWRVGRNDSNASYFAGEIDELRLWRSVRSVSEIRSFMFKPYEGITTNLMAYWQFNEGTGSTANDGVNEIPANLYNSPGWVTSTIPFGGGTLTSETSFSSGETTVGNATLNMADAFDNPVDVYVSELTATPNQFPNGYNSTFKGKYFVIDVFGTTGTFNASITLSFGAGAISEVEAATPSNYKLYKRSTTSTGGWTSVGGASSADYTTGKVTWNNITSFSQFAVVQGEGYNLIQLADNSDVIAYDDSTFTFASSFFDLNDTYVDTTFTISVSSTPVGSLYLDVNANSSYDSGTDNLLQNGNSFSYTPSGATKLRFNSTIQGLQTLTISLAAIEYSDSVPLDFFTVEGKPSLTGTESHNRWITLANPMTTTIGSMFNDIWTQGAPNSNAPAGTANLYNFDTNIADWSPITSDLNTTSLSTGQGILAYVFEDDVYGGGVDGGWPKTLSNYGTPIGSSASIAVKNVDVDESVTTNGDEGWNLIGNPFGWPISIDSVLATLDRADASANANLYILNNAGVFEDFTSGSLNAYQAAFIRVMGASVNTSLTFDSGDIFVDNEAKSAVEKKLELVLTHTGSGITSTSEFKYNSKAKTGIDKYDVYYLTPFADKYANMYSKVDDQKLKVNFLPESFDGEFRYPLVLSTTESGEFTLSWDVALLPEKGELFLLNNSTGEEINVRKTNSVTFMNDVNKTSTKAENFGNKISKTAESGTAKFTLIVRGSLTTAVEEIEKPTVVELFQNYPNPFNPETIISFDLTQTARVSIKIYDMLGRLVAEPVSATLTAGKHTKAFNGQALASGVYLYTMSINGKPFKTRKLMLLK